MPIPFPSDVNFNDDEAEMDASSESKAQTAVILSHNTTNEGGTDAPVTAAGESTTTSVEGRRLLVGGCIHNCIH